MFNQTEAQVDFVLNVKFQLRHTWELFSSATSEAPSVSCSHILGLMMYFLKETHYFGNWFVTIQVYDYKEMTHWARASLSNPFEPLFWSLWECCPHSVWASVAENIFSQLDSGWGRVLNVTLRHQLSRTQTCKICHWAVVCSGFFLFWGHVIFSQVWFWLMAFI